MYNAHHHENDVVDVKSSTDLSSNIDDDEMFGFISYNLPKQAKIAILIRLLVCMFMFQALNSAIECIPVIVLYQSFGVSFTWLFIWSVWWMVPVILLIHLNYVIKKYIHCLRNPHKYFKITLQDTDYTLNSNYMQIIDTKRLTNIDGRKWYKKLDDWINETEPEHIKHIAWRLKTYKKHLIINLFIYLTVFVINIIFAINTEREYASYAFDESFIISFSFT